MRWTGLMSKGASSETGSRTLESFCRARNGVSSLCKGRPGIDVRRGQHSPRWRGLALPSSWRSRAHTPRSGPPVGVGEGSVTDSITPSSACTHHLKEEMTESLLIRRPARVGLDANKESALKVGERVEVEEEVMDLVLRDDIVGLHLTLIVLVVGGNKGACEGAQLSARPERVRKDASPSRVRDSPGAPRGPARICARCRESP